ncbi:MAG: hypothetical protein JXA37_05315 [Chloroflexia bacterium]|nr:hypothetical protein [Chloroflexia bacterium]
MYRQKFLVLALVLLLLGSASLGSPVSMARTPNRAGLVVRFGDGSYTTRCVSFDEAQISGLDVVLRSGLDVEYTVDPGMGCFMCRIAHEGCPAANCDCDYPPNYWSYWHLQNGQWVYGQAGMSSYMVQDGAVEGWSWGDGSLPPPVIPFAEICPAPITSTPLPSPTPLPTHTPPPTALPTDTPVPTPAPTDTDAPTETPAPTATVGPTESPAPSHTPTQSPTPTPTWTPTISPTAGLATATPTLSPTATPSPTVVLRTPTPTAVPATPMPTPTAILPADTPAPSSSPTPAPTAPPSVARTAVPEPSPPPTLCLLPPTPPTMTPSKDPVPSTPTATAAEAASPAPTRALEADVPAEGAPVGGYIFLGLLVLLLTGMLVVFGLKQQAS